MAYVSYKHIDYCETAAVEYECIKITTVFI